MLSLPLFIPAIFIATVLLTLALIVLNLYKTKGITKRVLWITAAILLDWIIIQSLLTYFEFYSDNPAAIPPRFLLLVLPILLSILIIILSKRGKKFMDGMDLKSLTILHIVRIPVELVLYALFLESTVPKLMTFEGVNYDILSGITAPIVIWLGYQMDAVNWRRLLLWWNVICLLLLINIVVHAVLSAPLFFQKMAFDQPNIAVFYFPFSLLPAFVVPAVLFAHLASIRILVKTPEA